MNLEKSTTDDKIEILSLKVSRCQEYFAAIAGKNMIKGKEELHQILVYKINAKNNFTMVSEHNLEEKFRSFSKTFEFCYRKDSKPGQSLILFARGEIVQYDFNKKEKQFSNIYTFKNSLSD